MMFKSGKYAGKSYAYVVLRHGDHTSYLVNNFDTPASIELQRLIRKFDAKPFVVQCDGCHIAVATRVSSYANTPSLMFWCEECDMYSAGVDRGKLTEIKTYRQAVDTCATTRAEKADIIKKFSAAKGCPIRLTDAAAETFLQ